MSTYYKWQRQLYQAAAAEQPQFVEVTPKAGHTAAVLRLNGAEVELAAGIDEETLSVICRVLRSC